MSKSIIIIGATGMIGKAVANQLNEDGFKVRVLTRDAAKAREILGKPQIGLKEFFHLYRESISIH